MKWAIFYRYYVQWCSRNTYENVHLSLCLTFIIIYSIPITTFSNCNPYLQFLCSKWYIFKTQINVQPLIDVQSSNPCPISKSQTSVPQIYVLFSNSQIGVQFSNLWPFLTFSTRCPMAPLTCALTLTLSNKLPIDLRIWKEHRFENTLKSDHDLR